MIHIIFRWPSPKLPDFHWLSPRKNNCLTLPDVPGQCKPWTLCNTHMIDTLMAVLCTPVPHISYHLHGWAVSECVGFNVPLDTGHFGDESFQAINCTGTDKWLSSLAYRLRMYVLLSIVNTKLENVAINNVSPQKVTRCDAIANLKCLGPGTPAT